MDFFIDPLGCSELEAFSSFSKIRLLPFLSMLKLPTKQQCAGTWVCSCNASDCSGSVFAGSALCWRDWYCQEIRCTDHLLVLPWLWGLHWSGFQRVLIVLFMSKPASIYSLCSCVDFSCLFTSRSMLIKFGHFHVQVPLVLCVTLYLIVMIIIGVMSVALCLSDKGEHTMLYKINKKKYT